MPATGKPKFTPYQIGPVTADFLAKDMMFTDPSTQITTPLDFSGWITITPQSFPYNSPQTGPTVSATVAVPQDATLGQYSAKLVAKGPNGIGWGEGAGIHITFTVVAPTIIDTTPPVVNIVEPALVNGEPQNFTLGNRVPVDFIAQDQESAVTAWTSVLLPGSVNIASLLTPSAIENGIEVEGYVLTAVPGGTETIQSIGQYTLQVTATSEGGTSAPATRVFNVNYNINPLPPDFNQATVIFDKSDKNCTKHNPGDIQVKFTASAVQPADTISDDYSTEMFVRDQNVLIVIVDSNGTVVDGYSRIYGINPQSAVNITGQTGDSLSTSNYLTKYSLCGLTNGSYSIKVYFPDHSNIDYLQFIKSLTVQD